jgi:hypothetical protein
MKRSLSSTFVRLDLRKIIQVVAHDIVKHDFENNSLKQDEGYAISIYSDPTLEDGVCEYVQDDESYQVFLCSNQHTLLSEITDHVLATRMQQIGVIEFDFKGEKARCSFTHDSISRYDDCVLWTIALVSWDFDRECYFGKELVICPNARNTPKELLSWKGEEGMCKSKRCCNEEDCERWIFCTTHDAQHEEIHKKPE